MPKVEGLTIKEKLFVKEYLKDFNITQAAIRCGYSETSAYSTGWDLLRKPEIQEAIQEEMKKICKRAEISVDSVLEELKKVAFSDIKDFVEFGNDKLKIKNDKDVDGKVLAEISSNTGSRGTTVKLKLHDKMKALELLGKYLSMFSDNVNVHTTPEPVRLTLDEINRRIKEMKAVKEL